MQPKRYNGKRVSSPSAQSKGRRSRRQHRGFSFHLPQMRVSRDVQPILRLLFFPLLFLYQELVLHIFMGTTLVYLPIYLMFSIAGGLVVAALTIPFPYRINQFLTRLITFVISLVYIVEIVCKQILQSYYPLSTAGTAAENHLTDYIDVIIPTVLKDIPLILIILLPFLLILVRGKQLTGYHRFDVRMCLLTLVGALVFHIAGLGVVHLPWSGDLTPKRLYHMDTNIEDQVEQLGMLNMMRLDVKHMIIPAKNPIDDDFSSIGNGDGSEPATSAAASTGEEKPNEEKPDASQVNTAPNVMNVDLAALAESSKNEDVKWLSNFFNSVTPTNKNEYTGMFEGYNVIQLCLEGFSGYAIDPELTPTLYKLSHEGFVFNNFYTPLHFTSTSNGECQSLLGLYPKNGNPITMKRTGQLKSNMYFSLAQQLKRKGYQVMGFHGNQDMYGRLASHTNLGYEFRQFGAGLECETSESGKLLWPQRDSYVMEASMDDYIHSNTPFHVYYMTISGHMPYSDNRVVAPYRDVVRALPYSEVTQNYIATAMEVDKALSVLLQRLEEAGKLDKTLIVAAADHIPYFDIATLEELTGRSFGNSKEVEQLNEKNLDFDVYKNTLIMWTPSIKKPIQVDKVCGQVDILPTISNLLGLEYDSRMLAGSDILSDSEGMVIFSSRCWKTDKGFYNRFTQKFTPAPGVNMSQQEQESYVSSMKKLVGYKLDSTDKIVENNYYDVVFGNK